MLPMVDTVDFVDWIFAEPKPHKCPVCEGSGEVKQTTYTSTSAGLMENYATHTMVNCHGCNGKGWVTV